MMTNARLAAFLDALDYPHDECKEADGACVLKVDDVTCSVRETNGAYRLVCSLGRAGSVDAGLLAGYANGRLLRERAVLAWDPVTDGPILWDRIPRDADSVRIRAEFETFLASCEWWQARVDEMKGGTQAVPEMMIVP